MFYSDRDIKRALSNGDLRIEPLNESQIGPTSVDLHLGTVLVRYTSEKIELGRSDPEIEEILIDPQTGFRLDPGGFVLGSTLETVYVSSTLQGWIETKGDIARAGIKVHNCDGHVDPGFHGTVTLEIANHNTIPVILFPGIRFCQMFLMQLLSECERPYSGKYLGQIKPSHYVTKKSSR